MNKYIILPLLVFVSALMYLIFYASSGDPLWIEGILITITYFVLAVIIFFIFAKKDPKIFFLGEDMKVW